MPPQLRDIIVGILRIVYLVALNSAEDYTWTAVNCWIWSVLEPSLAVMVACGPTLGPVVSACFGRSKSSRGSSNKYPFYPERVEHRQQFSSLSDSEYPLKPVYGNRSVVGSTGVATASIVNGAAGMDWADREPHLEHVGEDDRTAGIRVQREVSVQQSSQGLAF